MENISLPTGALIARAVSVYFLLHFALYLAVFRYRKAFTRESTIFLYHAIPSAALAVLLLAWASLHAASSDFAEATFFVMLHGVYSLSFLELWSLSESGYSLSIVAYVARKGPNADLRHGLKSMHETGDYKKKKRIESLLGLNLVVRKDKQLAVTPKGRIFAAGLFVFRWLINEHRRES